MAHFIVTLDYKQREIKGRLKTLKKHMANKGIGKLQVKGLYFQCHPGAGMGHLSKQRTS